MLDTAVLHPVDAVPDDAAVGEVPLAQPVGRGEGGLVARLLVLEDTSAAVGLVFERDVQA